MGVEGGSDCVGATRERDRLCLAFGSAAASFGSDFDLERRVRLGLGLVSTCSSIFAAAGSAVAGAFKPPNEIDGLVLDTLRQCFSRFQPFKFCLTKINQFPGETLYLVPEPEDPFRELTLGIWRCYPETPPISRAIFDGRPSPDRRRPHG